MFWFDCIVTENPVKDAAMTPVARVDDPMMGLQWTKRAMGGMISASFNIFTDEITAFRWLNDHIGRRVIFRNPLAKNSDFICWEGLVYTVAVNANGTTISRTMGDGYNRVEVQYAVLDASVSPPASGEQKRTAVANDTTSQAAYGIRHLFTSVGTITDNDAAYLRDLMITQYRYPLANAIAGNRTQPGQYMVSVDCVGLWELLDKRLWSDASTSNVSTDTIIKAILDPSTGVGQFLSSDQTDITANAMVRTRFFDTNRPTTAQSAIELICSLGDPSNPYSWVCGIGAQRKPYYKALTFDGGYLTRRDDPTGEVFDLESGERVYPWMLEPGRMIRIPDLMTGAVTLSDATLEARNQMIDEVTFVAPNAVQWRPRLPADVVDLKLSRLSQGYYTNIWGWPGPGAYFPPDVPTPAPSPQPPYVPIPPTPMPEFPPGLPALPPGVSPHP